MKNIIGKIAADKDSKKLGRIARVEMLLGKTVKVDKPHAMIIVERRLKKPLLIPLDIDKIEKMEGIYVWFNITKKEFKEQIKQTEDIILEREIYTGDTGFRKVKGNLGFAYDQTNLSRKSKERRR